MTTFWYSKLRRKRGQTTCVLAVICEILFLFFLLAGFGEQLWAWIASLTLTLTMAIFFCYGISLSRSGGGGVEVSTEGLTLFRGKSKQQIDWDAIESIRFGGIFQGWLVLETKSSKGIIYRALPGYPLIWERLRNIPAVSFECSEALIISCRRSQHMISIILVLVMLLGVTVFLVVVGLPAGLTPIPVISAAILFLAVMGLGLWVLLKNNQVITLTNEGIKSRSWGKVSEIPAAAMKGVQLVQAPIKELVVGYRYRGELLTTTVSYAPVELGLAIRLVLAEGEWGINETVTGFPMEQLYEELCRRYQLTGETWYRNCNKS